MRETEEEKVLEVIIHPSHPPIMTFAHASICARVYYGNTALSIQT